MKFQIRFWSTFFTILGLAILIALGSWQAKRYLSKKDFEEARDAQIDLPPLADPTAAEIESGSLDFRRIEISGVWDQERAFLVKHRVFRGQPGFWVVNPLLIDLPDREEPIALLVNRGWIPFADGTERAETLLEALPGGEVRVAGLIHILEHVIPDRPFRLSLQSEPFPDGVLPTDSYDTDAMNLAIPAAAFSRPLVLTVGESPDQTDTYPLASFDHITEPYLTSETHFGYALTWYVLAIALIAIWIAQGLGLLHAQSFGPSQEGELREDPSPPNS